MQKILTEWRQYLTETGLPSFTYSQKAVDLIKGFEHFSAEPYDDKCKYTKLKGGKTGPKPKRKNVAVLLLLDMEPHFIRVERLSLLKISP